MCSVNSVGRCNGSLVGALLAWLVQWRLLSCYFLHKSFVFLRLKVYLCISDKK